MSMTDRTYEVRGIKDKTVLHGARATVTADSAADAVRQTVIDLGWDVDSAAVDSSLPDGGHERTVFHASEIAALVRSALTEEGAGRDRARGEVHTRMRAIERLVRLGKRLGLDISDMAKLAGISRQTVYTILGAPTKEDG